MRVVIIGTVVNSLLGFRRELIELLVAQGAVVYAFATNYDEDSKSLIKNIGAHPINYKFSRSGLNPFSDIFNTFKLAKQLKNLSADVVFTYFAKPVIYGTLAATSAGIKRKIGMIEGLGHVFSDQIYGNSWKTILIRKIQVFLYRFALHHLDCIIFLNPDDKKDLIDKHNICVNRVEILGGIGVNLNYYKYVEAPVKIINFIFVGRLLAEKGILEFLAAASYIKAKFPATTFTVLGQIDADSPGRLKQEQLDAYIHSELISYPGYVKNVDNWIQSSSVFVLPSYYREGVPRSTQEAMAIGRAVITTDMPGCRETVLNGINGFLIPPWDSKILADKMEYFILNPDQIRIMGMASRELAVKLFDSSKKNAALKNLIYGYEKNF